MAVAGASAATVPVSVSATLAEAAEALAPLAKDDNASVSMVETSAADAAWREGERGVVEAMNSVRSDAFDKCVNAFPSVYRASQKDKSPGDKGMAQCDTECAKLFNTAGPKYSHDKYKACYVCCDSFYGRAAPPKTQKEYHSCSEIKKDLDQVASGNHYLHNVKTGAIYKAFCDMDHYGGGWTRASEFDYPKNRLTDDIFAHGFEGWLADNAGKMETRIELVTDAGRTYRRFLRNNGIRGVGIDGRPAYSAKCKLSYAAPWGDAEDWGVSKKLEYNFSTELAKVRHTGSGNWKFNVLSACHRSLRASDGSTFTSMSNIPYSGGTCGGMTLSPTEIMSKTCRSSTTWTTQGPEGGKAVPYGNKIQGIKEIRIFVR
jgi:hypothetical protein